MVSFVYIMTSSYLHTTISLSHPLLPLPLKPFFIPVLLFSCMSCVTTSLSMGGELFTGAWGNLPATTPLRKVTFFPHCLSRSSEAPSITLICEEILMLMGPNSFSSWKISYIYAVDSDHIYSSLFPNLSQNISRSASCPFFLY